MNNIIINSITVKKFPREGDMINTYIPFRNLLSDPPTNDSFAIQPFNTVNLGYSHQYPLEIDIQNYPDGSVNLIINDNKHVPKLINSRFSTLESGRFTIPDHEGDKDTTLYDNQNLELDTSIYKTISQIPNIVFEGLEEDGNFPCGMYHFYFKLADNDGNESDFIGESSSVACHIGKISDPFSIRMGIENENSKKQVLFTLSNLDQTYDNVIIYYTRTTSGEDGSDLVTHYKILDGFPIKNNVCKIQLTGKEPAQLVTFEDINPRYYYCDHVKTQAICQNRLFFGNVQEQYVDYEQLKNISLYITAQPYWNEPFNNINFSYKDYFHNNYSHGYYNAKNIYYRTGYWPEEYYKFGIVFMLNNYSLTSVFNIRGRDFIQKINYPNTCNDINSEFLPKIHFNEEGFLLDKNNVIDIKENAFGICRMPKETEINSLLGVEFIMPPKVLEELNKLGIKGYFFVRQNRKPVIISQGVIIGKTTKNFGSIPVLKDYSSKSFFTESFLHKNKNRSGDTLTQKRSIININEDNVKLNAAIVPEAVVREPLYNQIFLNQDFHYEVVARQENESFSLASKYRYYHSPNIYNESEISGITSFLNIPSGVKIKTNGEEYYSSQAGYAEDLSTFISVLHDWQHEGNESVEGFEAKKAYVN